MNNLDLKRLGTLQISYSRLTNKNLKIIMITGIYHPEVSGVAN